MCDTYPGYCYAVAHVGLHAAVDLQVAVDLHARSCARSGGSRRGACGEGGIAPPQTLKLASPNSPQNERCSIHPIAPKMNDAPYIKRLSYS